MLEIKKYFPELEPNQIDKFKNLKSIYDDWNQKINVISRKDMDFFYEHHVLHSLSIGKVIHFKPVTRIMDCGTGGGFPGIPLAILFPDSHFHLVDSIAKKIKVVEGVATALQLKNVTYEVNRAEQLKTKFDFVVTRAVAPVPKLVEWCRKHISTRKFNSLPNGLLALKGGNLDEEISDFKIRTTVFEISNWISLPYFSEKKIVHITI